MSHNILHIFFQSYYFNDFIVPDVPPRKITLKRYGSSSIYRLLRLTHSSPQSRRVESSIKKRKDDSQLHGEKTRKEKASSQSRVAAAIEDDDIIYLNVGGVTFASNMSTLCQVPGSFLAPMFSGRWEDSLKKDKEGNVFLNFNPNCFKLILNYLRAQKTFRLPSIHPKNQCLLRRNIPIFTAWLIILA